MAWCCNRKAPSGKNSDGVFLWHFSDPSLQRQLEIKRCNAEIKKRLELNEAKIKLPIGSHLMYNDILRRRQVFVAARKACFGERFNRVVAGEALRKTSGGNGIRSPVKKCGLRYLWF